MVIIIVLNLIFGVIIDTFADLRSEKQKKEEILKTTCFICGEYLPHSGKQGAGQHGCARGHTAMGWAQNRPWAGRSRYSLPSLSSLGKQQRSLRPLLLGSIWEANKLCAVVASLPQGIKFWRVEKRPHI